MVKRLCFSHKLTALLFDCLHSWLTAWAFFWNISACFLFHLLFLRYLWLSVFLWILCVFRSLFWRVSYNLDSFSLLWFQIGMICRTFFFWLICLRDNRLGYYFLNVLLGKRAYRILLLGLLRKCWRIVSCFNWCIDIFTFFHILVIVD